MHFLIYGAGRAGLCLGGLLKQNGQQVSLLGRPDRIEALRASGLRMRTAQGLAEVSFDGWYGSFEDALGGAPLDAILLSVQSYDTLPAVFEIERSGGLPAPLISFQRGLGNLEALDAAFGQERISSGVLQARIERVAPAEIMAEGPIRLLLPTSDDSPGAVTRAFDPGITHHTTVSKAQLKWIETLVMLVGDALPTILDISPAETLADPALRAVEEAIIREAAGIMHLDGYELTDLPGLPALRLLRASQKRRGFFSPTLPRAMAGLLPAQSNLQRQMARGERRTEAAWTYGGVAQVADRLKRYAPLNHALALTLNDLIAGRIDPAAYRRNSELLLTSLRTVQRMEFTGDA